MKNFNRRLTRKVWVGTVPIGGDAPISVQSMTKTKTENITATVEQIHGLEEWGCQIIRVAVPDKAAAEAIKKIKNQIHIPLVADIHFDYNLALTALKGGVDKIRINPGNIGSREKVRRVLREAKSRNVPIRIGVNSGSLEKNLLKKYGKPTPDALVESAMRHISYCEDENFDQIVISLKSSDVYLMIEGYRLLSQKVDYPLHLGVTEAGSLWAGTVRSAIGIGTLLAEGIGDTIRVSLTSDPTEEIKAGTEILKSLEIINEGVSVLSCPTCGRIQVDLKKIVAEFEQECYKFSKPLKVALMGCAVNGPGESKEADLGIACGKGEALLYKKGEILKKIKEYEIVQVLLQEIQDWKE